MPETAHQQLARTEGRYCQDLNRYKEPCGNHATPGRVFCRWHPIGHRTQPTSRTKTCPLRCKGLKLDAEPCTANARKSTGYCHRHNEETDRQAVLHRCNPSANSFATVYRQVSVQQQADQMGQMAAHLNGTPTASGNDPLAAVTQLKHQFPDRPILLIL